MVRGTSQHLCNSCSNVDDRLQSLKKKMKETSGRDSKLDVFVTVTSRTLKIANIVPIKSNAFDRPTAFNRSRRFSFNL